MRNSVIVLNPSTFVLCGDTKSDIPKRVNALNAVEIFLITEKMHTPEEMAFPQRTQD